MHPKLATPARAPPRHARARRAASTGRRPRRSPSRSLLAEGDPGPTHGPGHRARHVRAPPPRAPRRRNRREVRADPAPAEPRAPFEVYNSPLSETGALGFEYGYSVAVPTRARPLGGAVRRLRERRAGHHRPVHRLRAREVGADARGSRCSSRTATRATGRSTRARASSASCSSPRRRTSASSTARPPRSTSTCCAGRRCTPSAGRSSILTPKSLLRLKQATSHARRADRRAASAPVIDDPRLDGREARGRAARPLLGEGLLRHRRARGLRRGARASPSRGSSSSTRSRSPAYDELLARYPALEELVWSQEEPQNMGAWRASGTASRKALPAERRPSLRRPPVAGEPERGLPDGAHASSRTASRAKRSARSSPARDPAQEREDVCERPKVAEPALRFRSRSSSERACGELPDSLGTSQSVQSVSRKRRTCKAPAAFSFASQSSSDLSAASLASRGRPALDSNSARTRWASAR